MRFSWYNLIMENTFESTENWSEIIAGKDARIAELEALIKFYEEQFRLAKHRQFGSSSEKSEYEQFSFFNEAEATADANVPEPELAEIKRHFRKRKRLTNNRLPEDLPIEVVEHDLDVSEQICPECGGELHVMGREKRRELVIIPAQVKIREHIRKVYACRDCEKDECGVPILKASVDEAVIKGSFASPEAIAHIMTQKFVMGAPLYRQEQDWNRQGIMLSRQTMSNWAGRKTQKARFTARPSVLAA
jgi:transposase